MNANYPSLPLSISWHFLPIAEHYIHSAIKERAGNMIIIQQYTFRHTHFLFIHSRVSVYKHHIASNSLANCHHCPALGMPDALSASISHCLGLVGRPSLERTQAAWMLNSTLCLWIKPAWLGCRFVILLRHFRTASGFGTLPVTITIPWEALRWGHTFWSINLKHSVQVPVSYLNSVQASCKMKSGFFKKISLSLSLF